ncbi:hypothetical protein HPB51_027490 [Rhipicephalus microplus]|uniref:Ionotropic glutamate receptor L-glutamate and glycine-binding domain-containing protein n=1 Tax=Rhipicephalus microplus TaxID=6941 RepID=A0A9J6CZQ9_RHIMP|nr:hypothetical protein HPB51_027490 [Rhipicephalus microplus]
MASAGYSSSTSLTEETPPRAASPPAAQPYQALSNQKLSVQAKKVAYKVYAQVRKSDPQLSVRAACRKVSELTGVSERSVFRIKLDVNSGTLKSPKTEADLAIGDLTITVSHSRVVDFTLPFMHTGIGILYRRPIQESRLFYFLLPLSLDVWLCLLAAYLGSALMLHLAARMAPAE